MTRTEAGRAARIEKIVAKIAAWAPTLPDFWTASFLRGESWTDEEIMKSLDVAVRRKIVREHVATCAIHPLGRNFSAYR